MTTKTTMLKNAQKLLEVINESRDGESRFCNDIWKKPIGKSYFTFKTPSTCGRCVQALMFLENIEPSWRSAPYVEYEGGRQYRIRYAALQAFAENGARGCKVQKMQEALLAAQMEMQKLIEQRKCKLQETVKFITEAHGVPAKVSPPLLQFLSKQKQLESLYIAGPELAAWYEEESINTGAGLTKIHILHVYKSGGEKTISLKWRDGRSERDDNHSNFIEKILRVSATKSAISVHVKTRTGKRTITLSTPIAKPLSKEKRASLNATNQVAFVAQVQAAIATTLQVKQQRQERQPQFLDVRPVGGGYTSYQAPVLIWFELDEQHGLAAWAFRDQIDAHVSDRQIRFEVYAMRHGTKPARIHEAHAFESEGLPSVSCQGLTPEGVVLRTAAGTVTQSYKRAS